LLKEVFPKVRWGDFRRALCILDPYGLHLDWKVIETAGRLGSIEIFLNFPIADMNRNVLWNEKDKVKQSQADRLTRFWGDESWKKIAYCTSRQQNIWGNYDTIKVNNDTVAEAFRQRLITVAGFKNVPKPVPMKNNQNSIIYYLYFASQKPVAMNIVKSIFKKYST
jgi:three-Cys-motif partner protein